MSYLSRITNYFASLYESLTTTPHHRTNTRNQTIFHLQRPASVIFDFSTLSTTGLKVTIPPHSLWKSGWYWHKTLPFCEIFESLSGNYFVEEKGVYAWGGGTSTGSGHSVYRLQPDDMILWYRNPHHAEAADHDMVYALKGSEDIMAFYRQVCGVNQDAEIYFSLPSTPLSLRGFYASLRYIPYIGPRMRAWLLKKMLWIQQRVVYYKNDYNTYEGRIDYTLPWRGRIGFPRPPKKWIDKELKSVVTISRLVQGLCFWVRTRILGMREKYAEYEAPIEGTLWKEKS
jgi:hypothetical protein